MLTVQDDADVAIVIDRHSTAKIVCCCHKSKLSRCNYCPLSGFPGREPSKITKVYPNASADLSMAAAYLNTWADSSRPHGCGRVVAPVHEMEDESQEGEA